MRSRCCLTCNMTLFALLLLPALSTAADDEPPNILFLFADDQSFETLGALGLTDIDTPNLDQLARRGVTFTHAYNMGGWHGAVCVASRTMLNTGRFLWHARDLEPRLEAERRAGRWWSEYLRAAGYDTYFSGKWHVKLDANKAFDVVAHVRPGMPNQTPEGYNRPIEGQPDSWSPSDPKFGGFWQGGKHWSEVLADDAESFLERAAQRDAPFFMYLAFNAPHDPRQSPQAYIDRYPLDRIETPENLLPRYPYADKIGCGPNLRDEALAPFPRSEYAVKVNRQEYYALVTHMDAQIGRILDALDASGKSQNTWIFFTADHGLSVGHHGLLGKQNMYDHSVRVPFLVVGPGVEAGRRDATPIYLQDVMPTTLELAGISRLDHVEFKSLLPRLRGEDAPHYDAIYGAYIDKQRMITKDGYKLIIYPEAGIVRLYHIANDPLEANDQASDPAYARVVARLTQRLGKLQNTVGDSADIGAPASSAAP